MNLSFFSPCHKRDSCFLPIRYLLFTCLCNVKLSHSNCYPSHTFAVTIRSLVLMQTSTSTLLFILPSVHFKAESPCSDSTSLSSCLHLSISEQTYPNHFYPTDCSLAFLLPAFLPPVSFGHARTTLGTTLIRALIVLHSDNGNFAIPEGRTVSIVNHQH